MFCCLYPFFFHCVVLTSYFSLSFPSFEEPCYVGRHLTYVVFVGITQIILYAIGLPLLVFVFLWRHRDELNKPVVKFRYGLFFSGFTQEKYYWECIVALRKESTVLLAVFGPQMGIPMLAHVALLVFMIQILVQLLGNPYAARQTKLQMLDVASIVICWGTMWSGFFFYSPRPPSQKQALEFLTVLVVTVNAMFMLALVFAMCSETCRENENNRVVKLFRDKTSSMKNVLVRKSSMRKHTQHLEQVENPALSEELAAIEMVNRKNTSEGYTTARLEPAPSSLSKNSGGDTKKKYRAKNKINKTKSRKMQPNQQQAPTIKNAAQQQRRRKLTLLHAKQQRLGAINDGSSAVLVEKDYEVDAVSMNIPKRKSFLKIDDQEHGIYFQDVDTKETVWVLPEDGDVVVNDNAMQHNPMNRKAFRKIVDDEHGVYFQDVETEETVWQLPEHGQVVS